MNDPRRWFGLLLAMALGLIVAMRAAAAVTLVPSDLSGVRVLPNPWRGDRHAGGPVLFNPLTTRTTVKIYTVSGRWVKTVSGNGSQLAWDLTNSSGERVASGIYLYVMTTYDGAKKKGQIVVIK